MKNIKIRLCLSIILILCFFSIDLVCEENHTLPDSIIYKERYKDLFIGYGADINDNTIKILSFSTIQSRKIKNMVYFTMDANFFSSNSSDDRYFDVSVSPGISLIKYFGESFRIYESTTFGLSYLSVNNNHDWSNFGYCAGLRFGIGYWRLSLETVLQHFVHKDVSITPLTFGIRVNTDGWF